MTAGAREGGTDAALGIRSFSKTFAGVRALRDVTVDVARGRVTALVGQNGSGKSTLVKILAGFYAPDGGGRLEVDGAELSLPVAAREAHRRGLRFVHQDLALVNEMSVANNIAFAQGFATRALATPIARRRHRAMARQALSRLGIDVDPDAPVGTLSSTERMLVAIARAFGNDDEAARVVMVLDEPTAYLPASAVDRVLNLLERIRDRGGTVVYVTHRLDEVVRIADDLIVLRDGAVVANEPIGELDAHAIARLIVGGEVEKDAGGRSAPAHEGLLTVSGLSGTRVSDVSFALHKGEILGVAGLQGCGRSELVRMIAGVQRPTSGSIDLGGMPYSPNGPAAALIAGVGYVPSDRRHHGIVGDLSLRANVTLADLKPYWRRGRLDKTAERTDVLRLMDQLDIRPRRPDQLLARFSGGNQQKAVLAKLLRLEPRVLAVDELTQGVDVGGKAEITRVLRDFVSRGGAVVLGASDFEEISELCDRVLVLDRGRSLGIFERGVLDESRLAVLAADEYQVVQG